MTLRVLDGAEEAGRALADWMAGRARAALGERGRFDLAVPGGRSPFTTFTALAAAGLDGSRVHVWLTDERALPDGDPERNDRRVLERLVRPAGWPPANLHRVEPAEEPERAAQAYALSLPRPLDLVVLGLGEDGHVASLFPGSPLLDERATTVAVARDCPKPPPIRVTLTPLALGEARAVAVLALGADKARAAAAAREGGPALEVPARLVRDRDWWLDRAAASLLRSPHPMEERAGRKDGA